MEPRRGGLNLYSISSDAPFLLSFARSFLQGQLFPDYKLDFSNPLALSCVEIYVPTKRAARSLSQIFLDLNPQKSCFLPRIIPFSDLEATQEQLSFVQKDILSLPPKIEFLDRLLLLARLVRPWHKRLPDYARQLFSDSLIEVPTCSSDAIHLGRMLSDLLDEVEREGADIEKIKAIIPEDLAGWWQITREFLEIILSHWDSILAERGVISKERWRQEILKKQISLWDKAPPKCPVIALGLKSEDKFTANFLKKIASLDLGAVILPGLDRYLSDSIWQDLDNKAVLTNFSHPQYVLKRLLSFFEVDRDTVIFLGEGSKEKKERERLLSMALWPVEATKDWNLVDKSFAETALQHVSLIEAPTENEEALAIALALREAIEDSSKTAALVTGDRILARRVAVQLARFGVIANSSVGEPLSETAPLNFVRLLLSAIFDDPDGLYFLSLMKHPYFHAGFSRSETRALVERFEFLFLREDFNKEQLSLKFDIKSCVQFFEGVKASWEEERLQKEGELLSKISCLLRRIEVAIKPLMVFYGAEAASIDKLSIATVSVCEELAKDMQGEHKLYEGEAGKAFVCFFQELILERSEFTFSSQEWPSILSALLVDINITPEAYGHDRLYIWGRLEARLQTVDTVVIAGMNEGEMPKVQGSDPFMSRMMKQEISLKPPEYKIGIEAHDFSMLFGMDRVILSRSLRTGGEPTQKSRWLERLQILAGEENFAMIRKRGKKYLSYGHLLDESSLVSLAERPCPKPSVHIRPKHYSVTDLELLQNNPYAIYAKKILRLKPLSPIRREISKRALGIFFHALIARLGSVSWKGSEEALRKQFLQILEEEFSQLRLEPAVEILWYSRFYALGEDYIYWERAQASSEKFFEISSLPLPIGDSGAFVKGRADRIQKNIDGTVDIIDFKTGALPSKTSVYNFEKLQLLLEAILLQEGAFLIKPPVKLGKLFYIHLGTRGSLEILDITEGKRKDGIALTAEELAREAWERLEDLIKYYNNPQSGYISYRISRDSSSYENAYDHLSRVKEWEINKSLVPNI